MNSFRHQDEHIDSNMVKIEVTIDDMSSEWMGHLMEQLFSLGVNDVYYSSVYMKKNRPGILLTILVSSEKLEETKKMIFLETTTFGVRYSRWEVHRLGRQFIKVDTKWGIITVKQAIMDNQVVQESPEYEECKQIALKEKIPIKIVYKEVWESLRHNARD